ncbi:hypothetical protein JK386_15505 [Nocardioides sp. zg-536]|uniref:Uncharacterized protein n=1 Tax=Nocardioides faecalis TaxID=2803858 RepID=A0A939BX43_9ACTN|nr:hypothetical protein [Nocardioides faecalis]MBM9461307.1 hypothetical protein [Nocardioides faecalis]QVI57681.1 hypothetical protein KG111_11390 [Nocardioides faecalis]
MPTMIPGPQPTVGERQRRIVRVLAIVALVLAVVQVVGIIAMVIADAAAEVLGGWSGLIALMLAPPVLLALAASIGAMVWSARPAGLPLAVLGLAVGAFSLLGVVTTMVPI